MTELISDYSNLETYFQSLVAEHQVVGASVAILSNNTVYQAAAGQLNVGM